MTKFGINASGAIWWPNFEIIQVVPLKSIFNYSSWKWKINSRVNTLPGSVVPLAMFLEKYGMGANGRSFLINATYFKRYFQSQFSDKNCNIVSWSGGQRWFDSFLKMYKDSWIQASLKYATNPARAPILLERYFTKVLVWNSAFLWSLTPLPAQISASNFHDLTQITLCARWSRSRSSRSWR